MTFLKQLTTYHQEYIDYLEDLERAPAQPTLKGFIDWLNYYKKDEL
jgi:hypothetical protein